MLRAVLQATGDPSAAVHALHAPLCLPRGCLHALVARDPRLAARPPGGALGVPGPTSPEDRGGPAARGGTRAVPCGVTVEGQPAPPASIPLETLRAAKRNTCSASSFLWDDKDLAAACEQLYA